MGYLHKITPFVTGVLITFGRVGLATVVGRMYSFTHSKLANPELRLLSLSKKFATISLRGRAHVNMARFEAAPDVSR
jgi:hypothetical protein